MKKFTKTMAKLSLVALPLAAMVAGAAPASARARQGNIPATCPAEGTDANGRPITSLPEGTRVGLWVCGADGQWHFGWLIDGRVSEPTPTSPKAQVVVSAPAALASR